MIRGREFHAILIQSLPMRRQSLGSLSLIQNSQCSIGEERLGAALVGGRIFSLDFAGKESGRGGHLLTLRSPGDFTVSVAGNQDEKPHRDPEKYAPAALIEHKRKEAAGERQSGHKPSAIAQERKSGRHVHRAPAAVVREAFARQDDPLSHRERLDAAVGSTAASRAALRTDNPPSPGTGAYEEMTGEATRAWGQTPPAVRAFRGWGADD